MSQEVVMMKEVRRKETVRRKEGFKKNRNWGRNEDMQPCQEQCMATIQRTQREEPRLMRSGKL